MNSKKIKPRLVMEPVGKWRNYHIIEEIVERYWPEIQGVRDGEWAEDRRYMYACKNQREIQKKIEDITKKRIEEGWERISATKFQRTLQTKIDEYPVHYSLEIVIGEEMYIGIERI